MEAKAGKTMNLSRNYQKLISAAVTLLGVVCIPQMLLSSGKGLDFSNSFLSVLLWGLSFPAADRALWKDKVLKGRTAWGFFGAFLFVMACLFGSRLEAAGYQIVMHVHDEAVIEAPVDASLDDICAIMGQTPAWAEGLLLRADGYVCDFYQKD